MTSTDTRTRKPGRGFLLFLLCFYAAWCLRVVLLLPIDGRIPSEWMRQCWSQGLRILIWVLPVIAYLKFYEGVRVVSFLKLDSLPRGRRLCLGVCLIVVFLVLCAMSACLLQGGGLSKVAAMTGLQWAALLAGMAIVAGAEEILYRGLIFQELRITQSFHRANLLTSGLFLVIHWPGWLYMQGPHWGLLTLSISILVVNWVLGLLLEVTRSLWPPIILHLANDVLSAALRP